MSRPPRPRRPGRPIGNRVREICEILEDIGPSGSGQIGQLMTLCASNVGKNCMRGVAYGLLTTDGKTPQTFDVVANWRVLVDAKVPKTNSEH
jgi:hypothetical protein